MHHISSFIYEIIGIHKEFLRRRLPVRTETYRTFSTEPRQPQRLSSLHVQVRHLLINCKVAFAQAGQATSQVVDKPAAHLPPSAEKLSWLVSRGAPAMAKLVPLGHVPRP